MWSFLFESLEIPKLVIWILFSFRKNSKIFSNSSSKLIFLTCSFRSSKLNVLVCVTLVFGMGFKIVFFSCFFLLGIFFFRDEVNGWIPDSNWRRASEEGLSSFLNISSLWENHRSPFCAEKLRLGNKNWECSRLCWQSFA